MDRQTDNKDIGHNGTRLDVLIVIPALLWYNCEEQLKQIEAIKTYRHITAADEFKEIARLRERARHNEASALGHARREGKAEGRREGEQIGGKRADEKWQGVVAEQAALIVELQARFGERNIKDEDE